MESAVNAPHPDATAEDAEDFFNSSVTLGAEESGQEEVKAGTAEEVETFSEAADEEVAKVSGANEREYRVFQRIELTRSMLGKLLKQLEETGDAHVAYVELDRVVERSDQYAVSEVYRRHREMLGLECEVAAVSSRSFKERKIAPRVPRNTDPFSIT